jgi:hypothetical protein
MNLCTLHTLTTEHDFTDCSKLLCQIGLIANRDLSGFSPNINACAHGPVAGVNQLDSLKKARSGQYLGGTIVFKLSN